MRYRGGASRGDRTGGDGVVGAGRPHPGRQPRPWRGATAADRFSGGMTVLLRCFDSHGGEWAISLPMAFAPAVDTTREGGALRLHVVLASAVEALANEVRRYLPAAPGRGMSAPTPALDLVEALHVRGAGGAWQVGDRGARVALTPAVRVPGPRGLRKAIHRRVGATHNLHESAWVPGAMAMAMVRPVAAPDIIHHGLPSTLRRRGVGLRTRRGLRVGEGKPFPKVNLGRRRAAIDEAGGSQAHRRGALKEGGRIGVEPLRSSERLLLLLLHLVGTRAPPGSGTTLHGPDLEGTWWGGGMQIRGRRAVLSRPAKQ